MTKVAFQGHISPFSSLSRWFILLMIPALWPMSADAQVPVVPDGTSPVHDFLTRQAVLGNISALELSSRPLSRFEIRSLMERLDRLRLPHRDQVALDYYLGRRPASLSEVDMTLPDSAETSGFFANGYDMLYARGDGYELSVNPVLDLSLGQAFFSGDSSRTTWNFGRGLRAFGTLDDWFFFDARVEEVQSAPANRFEARDETAPGLRAVKLSDAGEWDYVISRAVVGVRSRHLELRFGRDRNVFGGGTRTFWLSDVAPEYDFIRFRAAFWRIRYTGMFAAFDDLAARRATGTVPRKYAAFHHLAFSVGERVDLEFFESALVTADSADGVRAGFDLAMLNPLLHVRPLEWEYDNLGTKAIGLGIGVRVADGHRVRGQLLLTEFDASEIFSNPGYWANKWGYMLGYDFAPRGLPLLVRAEYARARPHLYSHRQSGTAYVHYDDFLGHPAGQNFVDWTLEAIYAPGADLSARLSLNYRVRGENSGGVNYGGDPREPYTTRHSEDDNSVLQGERSRELAVGVSVSKRVVPGGYLKLRLSVSEASERTGTIISSNAALSVVFDN